MVEKTRKPCPYCGTEVTSVKDIRTDSHISMHVIQCLSCGATGPCSIVTNNGDVQDMVGKSILKAIELWNQRKVAG